VREEGAGRGGPDRHPRRAGSGGHLGCHPHERVPDDTAHPGVASGGLRRLAPP
jgi:hypothetical protein